MADTSSHGSIFLNFPFDGKFLKVVRAILFTVCALRFTPRCALEYSDSGTLRLQKIYDLIKECRFAIHDLSRTEVSSDSGLPQFNMALELGIFLGVNNADSTGRSKTCLIFVKDRHNVSFITDIKGMDVEGHGDRAERVIAPIRNWLCTDANIDALPASVIKREFEKFENDLPKIISRIGYAPEEPNYSDYLRILKEWFAAPISL
jgi:hypothetical protein